MKKEWNANANLGKRTFMQSFGSQEWDTGFAIQALLASNLTDEIGPTLARGHDFIKKSQVWFPTLKVSCQYSHQLCFFALKKGYYPIFALTKSLISFYL